MTDWFLLRISARLRSPAIVASVAMNGGRWNRLIIRACIIPTARPIRSVSATAATTTAIDGDDAEAPGSHAVTSLALTTDARATTAPTERSMPPAMITTAAPIASTP